MARTLSARSAVCAALLIAAVMAVTSPMPFRPGYGLGSWIPEEVVESMRREAERRSEIYTLNNLDAEARSLEREVTLAATPVAGEPAMLTTEQAFAFKKQITDQRNSLFARKVKAITDLLTSMEHESQVGGKEGTASRGVLSTFGKAYQSPVDWKKSTIKTQDRAFDSLNVGVHFVQHETVDEDGSGEAFARKVLGTLKNTTSEVNGMTHDVETQAAQIAASKARQTASMHKIEGTLLVTAFATHRMVKQFDTFAVSADDLWRGWNYMFHDDAIANPLLQKDNFTKQLDDERKLNQRDVKRASIVSEVYLGSVIVGMVHFLQTETTTVKHSAATNRSSEMFRQDVAENVRQAQKLASQVGSTSIATDTARRLANLASKAGLNVQFDMVTIGFIPTLATNEVQLAVSKFKDFDPANFKVPTMLDADAEASTAAAMIQSNMQAVIAATIESVDKTSSSNKVLTSSAFMDAFADFASSSKSGGSIGAPIGINIKQFSKLDVLGALANKYLGMGIELGVDL